MLASRSIHNTWGTSPSGSAPIISSLGNSSFYQGTAYERCYWFLLELSKLFLSFIISGALSSALWLSFVYYFQAILQARVGRNVDGLDINLYHRSLELRRQFEVELMNSRVTWLLMREHDQSEVLSQGRKPVINDLCRSHSSVRYCW